MSLPQSTTVLIVGAGPSGLAAALTLIHYEFRDFLIVDAVAHGENTSRALAIHAATLEALDIIGCADDIISQGMKRTRLEIGTRSGVLIYPDFSSIKSYTRYPFAVIIPQSLTERILSAKLASFGVSVRRPQRVVDMKRNAENGLLTDVVFEDGRIVSARYVVGADGTHSVIRTTAGIGFSDPLSEQAEHVTNLAQIVSADIIFDAPNRDIPFTATLSPDSFFLCSPIPTTFNAFLAASGHPQITERIYRIGSGVPLKDGDIPRTPDKEYIQNLIDRFGPYAMSSKPSVNRKHGPLRIKDVIWSTRFRAHSALADTVFTRLGFPGSVEPRETEGGAILLIGDAAHIHSPAGGQGMNIGLRDAVFLGEALTKHVRATETEFRPLSEADAILRDFAAVRCARALEVIRLTKGLLSVMGADGPAWVYWWLPISKGTFRNWALWVAGKLPFVQRKIAWELSGLGRR